MDVYSYILNLIQSNYFECVEDAIDCIQYFYKSKKITLEQRKELLRII